MRSLIGSLFGTLMMGSAAFADPLIPYIAKFPLDLPVIAQMDHAKQKDLHCMALNIYHEARGTNPTFQSRVGWVTMNRLESGRHGDSICGVVFEVRHWRGRSYAQWTWTKKHHRVKFEPGSWRQAQIVATDVYLGRMPDVTKGGLQFMAGGKKHHRKHRRHH